MARTTMPDPRSATRGPGRAAPGRAVTIDSPQGVAELAAWLLSPHRIRPAVVATMRTGATGLVVDAEELAEQRGDRIDVYLIASDSLPSLLAEFLPDGCGVHSGAVRLYPATQSWHSSPADAPLLLARDRAEIDTLNSRLRAAIRTALRAANTEAAALAPRPSAVVAQFAPEASGEPTAATSVEEGVALARHLLNPFREWPIAVITSHPEVGRPYLPAASIAQDLTGLAAVVELSPDATCGFTDGLARRQLSAFYGAARVYPLGRDWVQEPGLAPLRICPGPARSRAVAAELVADGFAAARAAGLSAAESDEIVTGVVEGPIGEHRALVSVAGHGQATLTAARLGTGVPVDRLVSRGQEVRGRLRGAGPRPQFDPIPPDDDPAERVRATCRDGSVCLAKVAAVGSDSATVLLHPDVPAELARGNGDPELQHLLGVADVIAVRVDWSGERPTVALADPSGGALPGVGVWSDGPPWLRPADLEPDLIPALPHVEAEAPAVSQSAPAAEQHDRLGRRLQLAGDAVDQYAGALNQLQDRLEQAERLLAVARARSRAAHLASARRQHG